MDLELVLIVLTEVLTRPPRAGRIPPWAREHLITVASAVATAIVLANVFE